MATLIYDVDDLQDMNLDLAEDYELANDIDASATSAWNWDAGLAIFLGFAPVGAFASKFTGTFDGKGYIITDLYINRPSGTPAPGPGYIGLFGYADGATFKNVTFQGAEILGMYYVGVLVGEADNATIEDIAIHGTLEATSYDGGGLIGQADAVTIARCSSTAAIQCGYHAGGLIGVFKTFAAASTVEDSWASGNVTSDDYACGGFAGQMYAVTATRCYAAGNVTSDGYGFQIGGFTGVLRASSIVHECYATGNVVGDDYVGGFCGDVKSGCTISDCYSTGDATATGLAGDTEAGGFAADNGGTLQRCYSNGLVTGGVGETGGLCFLNDGTVTDCFWDTESSGQTTSAGGTGKTTAEMKTLATYSGWDMIPSSTDLNNRYPYLGWQIGDSMVWLITEGESPRETVGVQDKITLEVIRNIEMAAKGRFYIDEEGNAVYDSRFARQ